MKLLTTGMAYNNLPGAPAHAAVQVQSGGRERHRGVLALTAIRGDERIQEMMFR